MWLEMARDETHGGNGWEFGSCLWSPSVKTNGQRWPYWDLLKQVIGTGFRFAGGAFNASSAGWIQERPSCPQKGTRRDFSQRTTVSGL